MEKIEDETDSQLIIDLFSDSNELYKNCTAFPVIPPLSFEDI